MASNAYTFLISDAFKNTAKTHIPVSASIFSPSNTTLQSIKTDLQACLGGVIEQTELSTAQDGPGTPSPGTSAWAVVEDRMVVEGQGADNSILNYGIPAIVTAALNTTDNETLNLAASVVSAWTDQMDLYAVTEANLDVEILSGSRRKKKPMKR